ncbi:hypothetical protein EDD18DRAFT_99399 [Armillaria luteobubalina]|uniref:Uncharacterized protein n=1 Tax=Armillaria luteobubalina TaxID=153913 RepID=A0AA39P436_9AGAR|nr:hypothetical protein EDD18DRAFT_99399 [Armillaria luteobubalina]
MRVELARLLLALGRALFMVIPILCWVPAQGFTLAFRHSSMSAIDIRSTRKITLRNRLSMVVQPSNIGNVPLRRPAKQSELLADNGSQSQTVRRRRRKTRDKLGDCQIRFS